MFTINIEQIHSEQRYIIVERLIIYSASLLNPIMFTVNLSSYLFLLQIKMFTVNNVRPHQLLY